MSYPLEVEARGQIVRAARLMHMRGLIAGQDGNISAKVGANRLVCTPSGVNKGFLEERDLVVVDLQGNKLKGTNEPSSEIKMHLLVYYRRPDVNCVVHAHPPHCIACTLAGISLASLQLPETAFSLGSVPTARYSTPGTSEVPESIEPYVADCDAILLERHGSLTVGRTVMEAYDKLELLEHVAKVLFLARNLGEITPLDPSAVRRLKESVTSRGLPWKYPDEPGEDLTNVIVKRVLEKLRDRSV